MNILFEFFIKNNAAIIMALLCCGLIAFTLSRLFNRFICYIFSIKSKFIQMLLILLATGVFIAILSIGTYLIYN